MRASRSYLSAPYAGAHAVLVGFDHEVHVAARARRVRPHRLPEVAHPRAIGLVGRAGRRGRFDVEDIARRAAAAEGRVGVAGAAVRARQGEGRAERQRRALSSARARRSPRWRRRSARPGRAPSRSRAFPTRALSLNICWSATNGIGVTSSNSGVTAWRIGATTACVLLGRAEADDQQRVPGAGTVLLGNERRRRRAQADGEKRGRVRPAGS